MHVENPIWQNSLFDNWFAASETYGLQRNSDFNDWSQSQEGFGDFQVAITPRGRRADAYRQFLKPAEGRPNLTVVSRAQTTKVGGKGSAEVSWVCAGAAGLSVLSQAARPFFLTAPLNPSNRSRFTLRL